MISNRDLVGGERVRIIYENDIWQEHVEGIYMMYLFKTTHTNTQLKVNINKQKSFSAFRYTYNSWLRLQPLSKRFGEKRENS